MLSLNIFPGPRQNLSCAADENLAVAMKARDRERLAIWEGWEWGKARTGGRLGMGEGSQASLTFTNLLSSGQTFVRHKREKGERRYQKGQGERGRKGGRKGGEEGRKGEGKNKVFPFHKGKTFVEKFSLSLYGGRLRIRTADPLLVRQTL